MAESRQPQATGSRNLTPMGYHLRAAIYARVSSDQQAEARTIESQIEALLDRVRGDEVTVDEELKFIDEGYSGATLVRPALERLRDMAFAGAVDRLYVHSPDRLARKYAYQVLLVEELQRHGVELVFLDHQPGHTAEQDLLLQVQGMLAEYERAKMLERSRRGKRHAARRGSINVLGGAPYGYRYVRKQDAGGEAHYDVVLSKARIVRQMFQWIGLDRLSISEVCRRLNKQGVLTATGKSRWDHSTIGGILKNPAYKGAAAFGKTREGTYQPPLRLSRGRPSQPRRVSSTTRVPADQWIFIPVPAIIEQELFEAVQTQLAENRKRYRASRRGARHLLQGLLVCQQCGYALCGKQVTSRLASGGMKKYYYYRCLGRDPYRYGGQQICKNKQVRTDLLEDAVWEDVCSLLADPTRISEEYVRRLTSKPDDLSGSVTQLNKQIHKVKRGMARMVDAYEDGWLDKADFEQRMGRAKDRLGQLQAQAKAITDADAQRRELRLVIGRLGDFADRVAGSLQEADWATRREMIRALVKEVQVGEENVRIVYRVSPIPAGASSSSQRDQGVLSDCPRRGRSRPGTGGPAGARSGEIECKVAVGHIL